MDATEITMLTRHWLWYSRLRSHQNLILIIVVLSCRRTLPLTQYFGLGWRDLADWAADRIFKLAW